ncbi:hypothetical protein V8E53_007511 [Lactarius tabidus]
MHARQSRCDHPPRLLSVGLRSRKLRPRDGLCHFSYPNASPSPSSKQLSTSSSSSGYVRFRRNSVPANGGGLELSAAASDVGLDATQIHYVTFYLATDLRTFHCQCVCKMPLSGPAPSMLIRFLCKREAD